MGEGVVPGAGTSIGGAIGGVSCGAGVGCPGSDGWAGVSCGAGVGCPGWDGSAGGCGAGVSGGGCVAMDDPFTGENAAKP